ncbi:hypothetical protein VitviT2T_003721 [Vitis vinifera]|uniref:Bulb-type lectin domain-containing protein n=1 Tax=Vitis vinifera TaxID=29760 RepID=A0ABY9BNK5_VITVI|nr:hypothetical protein VitviT2T_003721 [Vitis vinifera]
MEERRKIHLVRWAVICKDKRHGGLGLRYLKDFNHALLGKWLWRFPIERESFWRRVIVGKFGEVQGGWTTREVRESYGTGLWKDIRKGWEEFFLKTRIRIGNGRQTRFWWDIWVGDSKLKDLFPLMFRIAANNSVVVADFWGRQEGGGGGWEVHFRRPFQDWELEEVSRFLGYISTVKVQEGEDFLVWKIERKGTFKVKSYYRSLKEDNSPLRTRFFAWEAVWGKISTVDMLMRRGWSMVNRCNLCKENKETANHILIHCGSKVELKADGQFTLEDPLGQFIWQAQSGAHGVAYAAMLESGNSVLASEDSSYVWESFKSPADTILPTQVLEIGGMLSSRQAEGNYSKGSNTHDAGNSSNSGERVIFDELGRLYVVLKNGGSVNLKSGSAEDSSGDYYHRATLDFDGVFRIYGHHKLQSNGSRAQSWPTCECLPGFSLVDTYKKVNGCKQNITQKCEPGGGSNPEDLFEKHELSNTFWAATANFEKMESYGEDLCWKSCLYDCNCVVAVLKEGTC